MQFHGNIVLYSIFHTIMAFFRGEEGSVSFDNGTGSVGAIASTTAWTLDTTKDTLETTASVVPEAFLNLTEPSSPRKNAMIQRKKSIYK